MGTTALTREPEVSPQVRLEERLQSDEPVLSSLLPVRNEGVNLTIMLKILRAVVDVSHEILVVHDCPHDSSVPVVSAIMPNQPRLRLVHNTLGRGVINAIRAGVAEARGEFVLIFAADEVGPVLALQD